MRDLVAQYLSRSISRRGFVGRPVKGGISLAAAEPNAQGLTRVIHASEASDTPEILQIEAAMEVVPSMSAR